MSLDGGGISNSPGAQDTASAVEEDYCLHARDRFYHQWVSSGAFQPGTLRHYGVTGEPNLLRSLKQTRMLGATFGTCFLGHLTHPQAAESERDGQDAALPFETLLLGPVQHPEFASNPQMAAEAWRREVHSAWEVLQTPSEWCQAMNGVVTELHWSTARQRRRIEEQLELASFMCVRAVQVTLPFYTADQPTCVEDAEEEEVATASEDGEAFLEDEESQRNTRLACLAADVLLRFIQRGSGVKVWVRCDACTPVHRYQMQRLRQAVLYGYTRRTVLLQGTSRRTVYRINAPCSVTGTRPSAPARSLSSATAATTVPGTVHAEAVSALMTMLYFSSLHPQMLLPSEWLGEQVVCFECPPAPLLLACMAPRGVAPPQHPRYRPNAARGVEATHMARHTATAAAVGASPLEMEGERGGEEDDADLCQAEGNNTPQHRHHNHHHSQHRPSLPFSTSRRSSPARLPDMVMTAATTAADGNENDVSGVLSSVDYSLGDWGEDILLDGQHTPAAAASRANTATPEVSVPPTPSSLGATPAAADTRRSSTQPLERYTYRLPDDLHPLREARWAGAYPPAVSVLTFLIELLRRRALPLFDRGFFDAYPLVNYLVFKAVEEPTRDVFACFEGQLQLPLQPLGHQLSSGVYEVFERDARKYRQYREAIYSFVTDWYTAGAARQHAWQNREFFDRHGVMKEVPMPSADERVLHLVLLGCGRGPIIDECLNAVSALGVRLRLFAIEKNAPAAAFTRMRWASDPEWAQLAHTFGHTLEVIVADGRRVAEAGVVLPADFGLCDVVVSELLGSLGDNELSPECLEDFYAQLLEVQRTRGLQRNPHLTCIPQSYTAWVAPLMSTSLEAAVAEAAVKGLTVSPPGCRDHHAALDHSLLVTNLSRGITLAAPQPCWTFTHDFSTRDPLTSAAAMERSVRLGFRVPPCGRCSGVAGFFSCVLYASPRSSAVTTLSTAPVGRTDDMYSWFPCTFTLDPTQRAELYEVKRTAAEADAGHDGLVSIEVNLSRKTSDSMRQVWYEWSVRYGDADSADGAAAAKVVVHNQNGWASSMLL